MNNLKRRMDWVLLPILLLAAFLNGYGIWNDKYANSYYTTAVASMLRNFHNFFYGSLDSAGSVTVDKPPVVFWIQTGFAYIFGLHGWSVILPQALAGVGSVLLIYLMLKPTFGITAARLSALAMATVPVVAAVSRTNNIDSMLVFTLLLGAWFLFKGVKLSSSWRIMIAFALIGLAFNMKMLQAYMVLPAFYLFYLLAFKAKWGKKIVVLIVSTAVMAVISLSWAVTVDSISADKRPYIGSSETNSVLELAFGYNGLSRLTGQQNRGGGGGMPGTGMTSSTNENNLSQGDTSANGMNGMQPPPDGGEDGGFGQGQNNRGGQPLQGFPGGGDNGRSGGMFGTGTKGPLRLFQTELSGQASWLLPTVIIGCVALLASLRRRNITAKHKEAVFWLVWLLPAAAFFSVAGFFHQYYLIMLAAPIAALAGAGFVEMWNAYRHQSNWQSWLLPAAILLTTIFGWYIMHPYDDTMGAGWSIGELAAGIAVTAALVVMKNNANPLKQTLVIAGFAVMLIGPAYWALTPITYGGNSMIPAAGPSGSNTFGGGMGAQDGRRGDREGGMNMGNMLFPSQANNGSSSDNSDNGAGGSAAGAAEESGPSGTRGANGAGGMAMPGGGSGPGSSEKVDEKTFKYLQQHNTGEEYLFAASDYNTAAPYIIDENAAVITLGGFSGSDPVYTTAKLEELVKSGKLKYFLIGGRGGNSEITTWVQEHGTEIPESEWKTTTSSGSSAMGRSGNGTLYEVKL
ncbi:glycosyltransferase family 39 protein [Paenibacillus sp. JX-17]|uniref:Glycosyltransferase family 39 protein n=1 Tax=Paenibacillus lacisoli TaxID=3064525 RepID=A0ABT9C8R1_9BACL|nr:glycosyltransferase family 39 protein [Paenibacillus sp. JX-17]MDO7905645.1 glycosyltransferase family 39 protein [Paenibacillus sp. JX-17]